MAPPAPTNTLNRALGNSFVATVDSLKAELGDERWITVSGITMNLKVEPRDEGGVVTHTRFETGGLSYSDLTLTRAVDEKTPKLVNWFAKHAYKVVPGTGSVRIIKPDGSTLHTYTFNHMVPITYKGPDLGMDKSGVITESVTFKHYGFADSLNGST